MIRALATMLVRALLETAIMLLACGLLLCVLSFRIGRRLLTDRDDPLERLSGRALQLASLIPPRAADSSPGEGTES